MTYHFDPAFKESSTLVDYKRDISSIPIGNLLPFSLSRGIRVNTWDPNCNKSLEAPPLVWWVDGSHAASVSPLPSFLLNLSLKFQWAYVKVKAISSIPLTYTHIIISVHAQTHKWHLLYSNFATVIKFYTLTSAVIGFSHCRNESGCKEYSKIDFLSRCSIYIAWKSGCKTSPCETIDITVWGVSVILPPVSLVCLLGLGYFHDGVTRSVWLWLHGGIEDMHRHTVVCMRTHTWVWSQSGTGGLGRYPWSNLTSSDLSWFPSCTQITCSYPELPDKDLWPWSDSKVDKERQHETDNTNTFSTSYPIFPQILSHTHIHIHSNYMTAQWTSTPTLYPLCCKWQ